MRSGPIAVFDSGVGGLTVFRELTRRLPNDDITYFGDSARVPYGTKSAATVIRYSREAAKFLMERDARLLVVACNTATAAALSILREELEIPVVGVIEPGARAAVAATKGKVGVIGTEATIRSGAYRNAIRKLAPDLEVRETAAPLFVPLAEEGWGSTHVCREVAEIYLEGLIDWGMDTLVLGCTHYPLLRSTLKAVAGDHVAIVDSAETTADEVCRLVRGDAASLPPERRRNGGGTLHFLVTDDAERFRRIAGSFLDHEVESLELVSLDGEGPADHGGSAGSMSRSP